jgi:ribonucleotide reductase alpha subunit
MDAAAGATPTLSGFFFEDNKDGVMPVVGMHLKDNPLAYARNVTRYKPWDVAKCVGWQQRWVDTGISAEYYMDKNDPAFTAKYLWDTLNAAWENKTKAVYYIRTIKQGESPVKDDGACVGCAG